MKKLVLMIFVDGSVKEQQCLCEQLMESIKKEFNAEVELHCVDVNKDPTQTNAENVILTPTIIRKEPLPEKRYVGTPKNMEQLISLLRAI